LINELYVPVDFGQGIIVPLMKDKTGDSSSLNNYRAITLIPVISKLFEHIILDVCDEYLISNDRQFGFKKRLGCGMLFSLCVVLWTISMIAAVLCLSGRAVLFSPSLYNVFIN